VLWGACQLFARKHAAAVRRAGIEDHGAGLGEALFQRILDSPSGTVISTHTEDEMWSWIRHSDGKIRLVIPEMIAEINALRDEPAADPELPLTLLAGERRSFNANTIIRDPSWRRRDPEGALKVSPEDAGAIGLAEGQLAVCESLRGAVRVRVEITDKMLPGVVSMPHGYGTVEDSTMYGPAVNQLTTAEHCDELAKTPFHKHVPVRVRPVAPSAEAGADELG